MLLFQKMRSVPWRNRSTQFCYPTSISLHFRGQQSKSTQKHSMRSFWIMFLTAISSASVCQRTTSLPIRSSRQSTTKSVMKSVKLTAAFLLRLASCPSLSPSSLPCAQSFYRFVSWWVPFRLQHPFWAKRSLDDRPLQTRQKDDSAWNTDVGTSLFCKNSSSALQEVW